MTERRQGEQKIAEVRVPDRAGQEPVGNGDSGVVGAALVVGAGVAGMQAALDLANGGYRVYLVDKAPAIGGTMAQLDKTFPTNDCAMCIMSPRLVECGRHLNIEIITGAELAGLSGEPGHFVARIKERARYVDVDKCTGCGDCASVCPVQIPDAFNSGLSRRRAVYKLYPQGVPNAFTIDKRGTSPCRHACPAGQRAQGYVALVRERRFADALRVIRQENPFPGVCGRICNHRCEDACSRAQVDEAVAICALKRFVVDRVYGETTAPEPGSLAPAERRTERVAIVGSGPAGLTSAHDLARQGYPVTVFEALPVVGGMMRVGVPEFRLPREVLDREVAEILALGVEIQTGSRVDDVAGLLDSGFRAVFLACGAHRARKLSIPGADHGDVLVATDFLRSVSLGESVPQVAAGRRVLVLGGGNVALDTARSARRLGAEVSLACLESRETMPGSREEVEAAEAEGIEVNPARSFLRILTGEAGGITGVECVGVASMSFDAEGRLALETRPGTEHVLPADVVIFAIGQAPDLAAVRERLPAGVALSRRGTIDVDRETLQTGHPAVFAGGDVVTGTTWVIDAIAAGHRAALSIQRYLQGQPLRVPADERPAAVEVNREEALSRIASGQASGRRRFEGGEKGKRAKGEDSPYPNPLPKGEGGFPLSPWERVGVRADWDPALLDEDAAVAEAERCLSCGGCSECLECVRACGRNAVDHGMVDSEREIEVGAVILALGAEPFDPKVKGEYGFGRYPNVLTSLQFERMLSASGPSSGHIYRPSDGQEPRRVAFIQCVGSRDVTCDRGYCSAVCCMYVAKEAVIAREHAPGIQPTVFYLDLRANGKNFERYCEAAQADHGVRYVRSMVSSVRQVPGSQNLRVKYTDPNGKPQEEEFDLVILAIGLGPSASARDLATGLGVELDGYGFPRLQPGSPVGTSRPGVFAAGSFAGPKDIPSSVVEASAAAAAVGRLLAPSRGTLVRRREYPPERDVSGEEPRVGVFVCRCGINIGGVVDVPAVVEHALTLPDVVYAEGNLYTCSQDTQQKIRDRVLEHNLNRVVVASCTPRTHEPLFQETIREAGLNPYLFEMANIREQNAWVHRTQPVLATRKAKDLVSMAASRARLLRPLSRHRFDLVSEALVVGGGLAGMTAALSLADQGFPTCLVEREAELGGQLRNLRYSLTEPQPPELLSGLAERVWSHSNIRVFTKATVQQFSGRTGRFNSVLQVEGDTPEEVHVTHGALVVATGGRAAAPAGYLYGEDARVVTQTELEALLAEVEGDVAWDGAQASRVELPARVAMIQCVGSRCEERPYCSKVCCPQAVKNALKLKSLAPQTEVYVLFRDLRTAGVLEEYYRQAREVGVRFLRYDAKRPPEVRRAGDGLEVKADLLGRQGPIRLGVDLVALSTGIDPGAHHDLAALLKLPLTEDGFYLEAHAKLRPLDFAVDGIFLCGLAHSPQTMSDVIAQAEGVASRAATLLSREMLESTGVVARVDERRCTGCGLCVSACSYEARRLDEESGVARVEEVLCQGCGSCSAACPSGATLQLTLERRQVLAMLEALTP